MTTIKSTLAAGEVRETDGWIYKEGQPIRRWLITIHNNGLGLRIKPERLPDIKALEALYWRSLQYRKRWYKRWFTPLFNDICSRGKRVELYARVKHTHRAEPGEKWFWKFVFEPANHPLYKVVDNKPVYTYSFEWAPNVKAPINLELGQRFYEMHMMAGQVGDRVYLCKTAFEYAVKQWIRPEAENVAAPKPGTFLHLNINNRDYWLQPNHISAVWELFYLPEDETLHVTI